MRRAFFLTILLGCGLTATCFGANPAVQVTVKPTGPNEFHITLQTEIRAPRDAVWKVLTDYDHHAGLLPYMTKSRIAVKSASEKTVEQEGKIRVLFWTYTMKVTQIVTEVPPQTMRFRSVAGDFERLEGTWTLGNAGTGSLLGCDFVMKPRAHVPEWAVRYAVKRYLTRMIKALA